MAFIVGSKKGPCTHAGKTIHGLCNNILLKQKRMVADGKHLLPHINIAVIDFRAAMFGKFLRIGRYRKSHAPLLFKNKFADVLKPL